MQRKLGLQPLHFVSTNGLQTDQATQYMTALSAEPGVSNLPEQLGFQTGQNSLKLSSWLLSIPNTG